MQGLLVLGFGAVLGAFWLLGKRYKAGEGPFDRLPAGVSGKPSATRLETVTDGTRYRVYDWPIGADGRSFHVAEVKGENRWISFWLVPTGQRIMVASLADASTLNDLRKDWAV